jgi:hypothetical protein
MPEQPDVMGMLAQQVSVALDAADLSAFAELLDPDVQWGPPDQSPPTCRNRTQVLSWYQRGRDAGVRARVSETVVLGDRILVGLKVIGNRADEPADGEAERWQVLTVRGGRVVDIVGFDERSEAMARALPEGA